MRIVISHLTRMTKGRICVAGIDLTSWEHIRPVLHNHLSIDLAATRGGPFALGAVLDLQRVSNRARRPEMEDREFRLDHLVTVGEARERLAGLRGLQRPEAQSFQAVCCQDHES